MSPNTKDLIKLMAYSQIFKIYLSVKENTNDQTNMRHFLLEIIPMEAQEQKFSSGSKSDFTKTL